jgi:serine/threonine-protein kinase
LNSARAAVVRSALAMPEAAKLPIYEGEILAGKYKVVRVIGVGGMGAVVECRHVELGQRVALKFLLPETLLDAECVTRFSREARAAVRLRSEHVARVTDVGKLENGAPYMVMEYLQGKDLAAKLEEHGPYAVSEAVNYVLQAAEGIAEAHSIRIIHRDLKPRNLFMTKRPNGQPLVKVLDFGIAKNISNTSTADTAITKISSLIGSPHYIAPEQMSSSAVIDGRADIWSLGVCLYEFLSGNVPFDAPTVLELCTQVLDQPGRPITDHRADLPAGIVDVIEKCLKKDPAERFADLGELAKALEPFAPIAMRGVADDICATLASPPSDEELPVASVSSRLSGPPIPPPAMIPGDLVAHGLSNPPVRRSLRVTESSADAHRRTVTIPPVSRKREDRGPRTFYVFATLALLAAVGYAAYVGLGERRWKPAAPPEVPTVGVSVSLAVAPASAPSSAPAPASASASSLASASASSSASSSSASASASSSAPVTSSPLPSPPPSPTYTHRRAPRPAETLDDPYAPPDTKPSGAAPAAP